jgi:hypothetical protein
MWHPQHRLVGRTDLGFLRFERDVGSGRHCESKNDRADESRADHGDLHCSASTCQEHAPLPCHNCSDREADFRQLGGL